MNGSGDDGFVVFTLGSMVASMPEEKAKLFFDAFRQIPQRVINKRIYQADIRYQLNEKNGHITINV